jgi:hypothetical protein
MQLKKMTIENEQYRNREIEWLENNDLDTEFLFQPIIEPPVLLSDSIKLDIVNLLPTKFFHNVIDGISRRLPPYNEFKYLQILTDYMERN